MAKLTLFILVAVLAFAVHAFKSYDGYVLIEAIPRNQQDRQTVDYLQEMDVELDFWHESPTGYEIFVPPEKQEFVTDFLTRNGLSVRVIKEFSQSDIDKEMSRLRLRRSATFDYNDFNTFDDIQKEIGSLAARCPIGVTCTVESIAKTYEGRDLWVLKLSKPGENRKGVWIDATIHSREWLATATLLKITQHLVDDYSTDDEVKSLVDKYDFYLLIVANPDGYEYSWTKQRYWRKNRTPNSGSTCIGTDLNRNFDSKWRNAGTSTNACSDSYGGSSPASEIETQALQNAAKQYGPTLATSIHIHSYSQLWLIPWGSYAEDGISCNIPVDYSEMMVVANKVADAIQSTYGTTWKRGSVCTTIYPATGGAVDYFKESGGVKYTATPELRGTDFVVDKDQIEPSFTEIWSGLRALFAALPAN